MANLELSRRSLSPEPQPLYSHKTWTRPGYMQPTPEERRTARRSYDRSAHSPPHPDRGPSLLLRMDLGAPYPSKSGPTDHGTSSRRSSTSTKSRSKRLAPEKMKDVSSGTSRPLALGSHRVEPLPGRAASARRGSFFKSGVANHETTNDMDIWASDGPGKGVSSLSRSGRRHPSPESSISDRSPGSRNLNGRRTVAHPTKERGQGNSDVPENAWSHLPLKDRITPLIMQNAHLRSNHDEYEMSNDQDIDTPSLDARNVDAVLTPDVCSSIATSLCVSMMQLGEADVLQPSQDHPSLPSTENTNPATVNPPAEIASRSTIPTSHPSCETIPHSIPSFPPESSASRTSHDRPPVFQQNMYDNRKQNESMLVMVDSALSGSSFRAEQYQSAPPALPTHGQQDAIPIPFFPAFFNKTPFQQASDMSQLDDMTHDHYGNHHNNGLEFSQNRPESPNPRPRKRPRSRSPQAPISSQYRKDNAGSRGRDRYSHSPPYPHGHSPVSPTSTSYGRHPQLSPHTSLRSRLPRSRSPRRREVNYSNGHYRQPTSTHRETSPYRSPSKLQLDPKYAHSHGARRESLDASASTYEKYSSPSPKAFKEPHPVADHSERYKQERSKREGEERVDRRRNSSSWEDSRRRRHSKSYTSQKITDRHLELPQKPASIMDSSTVLPTPPASAASINDRTPMTLRRSEELDEEINSTKSAVDSTRTSVDVPALGSADQEAPNAGTVGSAVTLTDTQKAETPWDPFNNIPGLWLLKDGSIEPDVLEQSLEVTRDIALKWDLPLLKDIEEPAPKEPGSHLKLKQNFLPKASWKLKCVPIEHVDVVRQTLNNPTTAKDLLHELSRLQSRWPTEGKLIIEVNPDHVLGKTFYAKHLDSVIPFVELKYYLHEGLNLIRIIQLGDMSKHVFILYAIPPSEPPMTNGALPQHGQELDYELSLDSLQCILQKSKASNGATSTTPLFKARSAKARISPTGDRAGGSDSK